MRLIVSLIVGVFLLAIIAGIIIGIDIERVTAPLDKPSVTSEESSDGLTADQILQIYIDNEEEIGKIWAAGEDEGDPGRTMRDAVLIWVERNKND
jgi:hypothetical protein